MVSQSFFHSYLIILNVYELVKNYNPHFYNRKKVLVLYYYVCKLTFSNFPPIFNCHPMDKKFPRTSNQLILFMKKLCVYSFGFYIKKLYTSIFVSHSCSV